jgi:tetratricopeptide (TPR) repeat protein
MKKETILKSNLRNSGGSRKNGNSSSGITKYYDEPGKKLIWISLLIIICITVVSYSPSFKNTFTNWDDEAYTINNPLIREISLQRTEDIFFGKGKFLMGNYHPLTVISLSIDYKLSKTGFLAGTGKSLRTGTLEIKHYDLEPLIFIIHNLVLHLLSIIILFWCIYLMTRKYLISILVAALFAIHPMHVESVTWIAERKDVLYSFFFLLSLLLYINYINLKQTRWYFLSLVLFIFALFTKVQAVTLTIVLFLTDYYKCRNLTNKKVLFEKIPYLFLSLVFGIIAIYAQSKSKSIQSAELYSFSSALVFATGNLFMYLFKLTIPLNLTAIHPYPPINISLPIKYYLYIIPSSILVLLLIYSILSKKKNLVFGLAFYLVNISPLLQLMPVGKALMADRYSYIPSVGYSFIIATGIYYFLNKKKNLAFPVILLLLIYFIFLSSQTFSQTKIWRNSYTLWIHTASKSPDSDVAQLNLGSVERDLKKFEDAFYHLSLAIKMGKNKSPDRYLTRGGALRELKRDKEAIQDFTKAIELKPDTPILAQAYHSRGVSEENLLQYDEAMKDYNQTIKLSQAKPEYFANRGRLFGKLEKLDSAIIDLDKAILMDSANYNYIGTRGAIYFKNKEYDKASNDFNKALKINSEYSAGYLNRGIYLFEIKQFTSAIQDFNVLLRLDPTSHDGYICRALCKRNSGDYDGAYDDYTKLLSLYPNSKLAYYQRAMLNIKYKAYSLVCDDLLKAKKLGYPSLDNFIKKYCR